MQIEKEFCFLSRQEANSWNRVNGAPGARMPDKTDHDRVTQIMDVCEGLGITRIRSDAGVKLWKSEN